MIYVSGADLFIIHISDHQLANLCADETKEKRLQTS